MKMQCLYLYSLQTKLFYCLSQHKDVYSGKQIKRQTTSIFLCTTVNRHHHASNYVQYVRCTMSSAQWIIKGHENE